MSTKHQKFKVTVSSKYNKFEKQAIAQDIIDFVVKRTKKRVDKTGKKMAGYSKSYAKTPEGQAAGKRAGQAANLKLSGDMLNALGEYKKIGDTSIEIGYTRSSKENAKADGNVRGTYGSNRASYKKARDFMGISKRGLDKVLSNYPLNNEEKRTENVLNSAAAKGIASAATAKTATKVDKNLLDSLLAAYGIE